MHVLIKGNVNCCERKDGDNPLTVKVDTNRQNIIENLMNE